MKKDGSGEQSKPKGVDRDPVSTNAHSKPQSAGENAEMAKGDAMQSELNEMRTQIEAMAADAERDRANVGSEVGRDEPSPEKETESEKPGAPEGAGGNLSAQIQELIEVINRDLRDSNPVTLLAVFAIGVITGRLLPR